MVNLYALVVSICLIGGRCEDVTPEVYTDLTLCVMEASHQRQQGFVSYCQEIQEDGVASEGHPKGEAIAQH